jgi:NAD(P)-dependent dehydrogenase (short-subunit alcohol dehydrogenase family)
MARLRLFQLIWHRKLTVRIANSGIGFGLAALLMEDSSKHVILCSRSISKGEAALKELQARNLPGSAELLQLDVTDEDSIAAAAKTVEATHGRYVHLTQSSKSRRTRTHERPDSTPSSTTQASPPSRRAPR